MNTIIIDAERCKGCCLCVESCPKRLISIADRPNFCGYYPARLQEGDGCTACIQCATVCPDVAIEVIRNIKNPQTEA